MSPLAIVLQAAIVGGALLGVLFLLGGTAVVDYLKARARATAAAELCGWCGGGCDECDECDPDRRYDPGEPGPCARHWTTDGSPCGCDPDNDLAEEYADILNDEVDLPEPDPGDEWDRARDRDLDYRAGVA
ncbi:hypothetical protein [Nocardia sp. MH4]|uniref:hypothetical protein n=1 Tax=Nocardia sp. MH4 TaxID=1768677 RepID=UPI001C4F4D59|nr:hypothetical protein [Nocardia sp. MH4]